MSSLGFAWVRRPGVSLLQPPTSHQARPSARVPCFYSDIESCNIADQECFSLSLRLQNAKVRLQAAVEKEDYLLAVDLRDLIARLELDHRRLSVAQARRDVMYDVGVVVKHRYRGYQGVVVGKDPTCLAPENWQKEQRVNLLPRGKNQPFYHVLVDTRDVPGSQTTYVAQENLVIVRRPRPIRHPLVTRYLNVLASPDGREWAYVPKAELRELYKDDF